jgi:hypothetical protein
MLTGMAADMGRRRRVNLQHGGLRERQGEAGIYDVWTSILFCE